MGTLTKDFNACKTFQRRRVCFLSYIVSKLVSELNKHKNPDIKFVT